MFGPCESDPFQASIEDGVVAVEEVEAEDPVAHVGGVHQTELALAG